MWDGDVITAARNERFPGGAVLGDEEVIIFVEALIYDRHAGWNDHGANDFSCCSALCFAVNDVEVSVLKIISATSHCHNKVITPVGHRVVLIALLQLMANDRTGRIGTGAFSSC